MVKYSLFSILLNVRLYINEQINTEKFFDYNKDGIVVRFDINKIKILILFFNNVQNECIDVTKDKTHDSAEGHWLESRMKIRHNPRNAPDLYGYEIKTRNRCLTTLMDLRATEYLFENEYERKNITLMNEWNDADIDVSKDEFYEYFGSYNEAKNRYSWSGKCFPKYNVYNESGQMIAVTDSNDIVIYYSYSKDLRSKKESFPSFLKRDNIVIALWKAKKLERCINNKFNRKGFFIFQKDGNAYNKLLFGKPFDFEHFITCFKDGIIILDSGMHQGNERCYSQFRGRPKFWNQLIVEEFE